VDAAVKILYLTDSLPDYLSDDLLYGLRSVLGADLVDYPRKDVLYQSSRLRQAAHRLYGAAFHCFGLDDLPIDRTDLLAKIGANHFDAIINSSGWRIHSPLHPQLVVMDGEDHGRFTSRYIEKVALYFKRELFVPRAGVEPILFALPDFLNDAGTVPRVQRVHASFRLTSDMRRRLAATFPPRYSFQTWDEYRHDIRQSWFAISPNGAGHDCQRHYEILGQAVLCIYMDAHAPWLLRRSFVDGENCLTFASVEELQDKLDRCTEPQRLIDRAGEDLRRLHLASRRAEQLLATLARYDLPRRKLSWLERLQWRYWLGRAAARHGRSPL
jgi:hypothetical protein